jgi:glycine hydroxymethyltransferase
VTRVAIVGGGLAAAAFLHQAGVPAVVYEQARELREVGAGIMVPPNAARMLRRLGVLDAFSERAVQLDIGWEFRRWRDGTVLSAQDLTAKSARLYGEHTYLTATMFGGADADLRAPTGSLANAIALAALGDRDRPVLTGGPRELGHFSLHAGGWGGLLADGVEFVSFQADGITVDGEALLRQVRAVEPAVIVVGSQAMLFPLDLGPVRKAADAVGAVVVYDAAHPLGLIAAGRFQQPLAEGADVITGSTQKSLPGPVGGVIVTRTAELGRRVYDATNRYMSNYQNNRVLAYGYTMVEMRAFGARYADATIANARFLAGEFARRGLEPLFAERGYTESNQFLVPWGTHEETVAFAQLCEQANIIVSVIALPGSAADQASHGLRIGVQDLTRHGLTREQFRQVADAIAVVAGEPGRVAQVAADMAELAARTATVYYDLDNGLPPS